MTEFHRTNFLSKSRPAERQVLLHYHIFKNAGTSVDAILGKCFGDTLMSVDGPVPEFFINQTEINVMVRNRTQVRALSSHQIRLPLPKTPRIEYLPIIFIRRPELRVQSMWRFQRSRSDSHPATKLARELDFPEWIRFHLDERRSSTFFNQQTHLFSFQYDERTTANHPALFERALANFESVPFVGLVENFSASMNIYQRLYQSRMPEMVFDEMPQLNRSSEEDGSDEDKIDGVRRTLGAELFAELDERMKMDVQLYRYCAEAFSRRLSELNDELA